MRTRAEAVKLIDQQMGENKTKLPASDPDYRFQCWHYGYVELRELLDFIYGGTPASEDEKLRKIRDAGPDS